MGVVTGTPKRILFFNSWGKTDKTFLGLEKLQHLLTDTLELRLYNYCQTDILQTFSSAQLAFTVTSLLLSLSLNHTLAMHTRLMLFFLGFSCLLQQGDKLCLRKAAGSKTKDCWKKKKQSLGNPSM